MVKTTTEQRGVRFGVLGPLQADVSGVPVALGGQRPRVVLAMLLLHAGRVVSVDRLIDGVWGEEAPEGVVNTLQAHVSHLRRLLAGGDAPLITQRPGYLVRVTGEQLDLLRFESLTQAAQARAHDGRTAEAVDLFGQALDLWRGPPLEDLGICPFADTARTFLEERRVAVVDDRLALMLDLGQERQVIETCEEVLATQPLRESLWERLIVALYRTGRQADALARYRQCRATLLDELGVEPMPRLRALEVQILNHDDRLVPDRLRTDAVVVPPREEAVPTGTETVLRPRRLDARLTSADGTVAALGERVVLGRHHACDIVLADASVSRRHAEIRLVNGRHLLLDLSSSNGTLVNGEPVLQHLLGDGDAVQLGDQTLTYHTLLPNPYGD